MSKDTYYETKLYIAPLSELSKTTVQGLVPTFAVEFLCPYWGSLQCTRCSVNIEVLNPECNVECWNCCYKIPCPCWTCDGDCDTCKSKTACHRRTPPETLVRRSYGNKTCRRCRYRRECDCKEE